MPADLPERHPDAFVLMNRVDGQDVRAVCEVWRDAAGWQVRLQLTGGGVLASAVVPTVFAVMETSAQWQAAMQALGWRE